MSLYGATWIQDNEPTTGVIPGQHWVAPTSGVENVRNSSNSAWTYFGNINEALGGAVSKSGDTMTGPLLGAPNLPPIDDPDFQGTPKQGGFPLATQLMLSRLQQNLRDYIAETVRAQFLSQTKLSGTAADVAANFTVLSYPLDTWVDTSHVNGVAAPLPTFKSDNIQATPDQILFWGYGAVDSLGESSSSFIRITSPGTMQVKVAWQGFTDNWAFGVGVWCMAVR